MSLFRNVVMNAGWSGVGSIINQLFSLVVSVVLARALSPQDFGLMGMALVFTNFIVLFSGLGVGMSIIQNQQMDDRYLSTARWTASLVGVALFTASCAAAPVAAWFFHDDRIRALMIASSLSFILTGVCNIHLSIMIKEMRFKEIAVIEVGSGFIGGGCAIVAAVNGFGVWSLVAQQVSAQVVRTIAVFMMVRGVPWRGFDWSVFRVLFSFSSYVIGSSVVNYFGRNADNLIIGRFLGSAALGYYGLAYSLMMKPIQVTALFSGVLYPALSSAKDDPLQFRDIYMRTIKLIALITFPAMLGMWVVTTPLILVVYGEKWVPIIPVFRILCLIGMIQSVLSCVGNIYMAMGETRLMFRVNMISLPFTLLSFIVGIRWGIVGVAFCYAIIAVIFWFVNYSIALRLIGMKIKQLFPYLKLPFIMSFTMALFVQLLLWFMSYMGAGSGLQLSLGVTGGILSYCAMIFLFSDDDIGKIKSAIYDKMGFVKSFRT